MFRPIFKRKVSCMANQAHSLAHTKWMCKYHIVFTPKHCRKASYNEYMENATFGRKGAMYQQGD